jgi:hypothetical protein
MIEFFKLIGLTKSKRRGEGQDEEKKFYHAWIIAILKTETGAFVKIPSSSSDVSKKLTYF